MWSTASLLEQSNRIHFTCHLDLTYTNITCTIVRIDIYDSNSSMCLFCNVSSLCCMWMMDIYFWLFSILKSLGKYLFGYIVVYNTKMSYIRNIYICIGRVWLWNRQTTHIIYMHMHLCIRTWYHFPFSRRQYMGGEEDDRENFISAFGIWNFDL